MINLYYIRHGQTDDNHAEHWGHYATPLNDTGRAQASAAGERVRNLGLYFDAIIASPQPRAQETAKLIAAKLDFMYEAIETMEQLMERQMGPLCGSSYNDFFADGKTYRDLDGIAGVEPLHNVQQRADQAFHYIRRRPDPTILVVSHGAFGRAFKRSVNGLPMEDEYREAQPYDIIPNATVFQLI